MCVSAFMLLLCVRVCVCVCALYTRRRYPRTYVQSTLCACACVCVWVRERVNVHGTGVDVCMLLSSSETLAAGRIRHQNDLPSSYLTYAHWHSVCISSQARNIQVNCVLKSILRYERFSAGPLRSPPIPEEVIFKVIAPRKQRIIERNELDH